MGGAVRVAVATIEQWEAVRDVRLAALGDAPDAFGSTLAAEVERTPDAWHEWIGRPDVAVLLAHLDDEGTTHAAGLAAVAPAHDQPVGTVGLYAVWVAPRARGRGVADALIEAAIALAAADGHRRLVLHVGDHNEAAMALYTRHGFVPTGRVGSLPAPRTHVTEHERARLLP